MVKKIVLRQNPIYNSKIQGIGLRGTVLESQDQHVKLHLAIDKEQNPDEAYWYPFAPPTTDALYLMPQTGTIVNLYIPGRQEQKALITGCIRTNGAECKQTSDPNTRYLATEYGQELKLAPGGIYLTAGREDLCLHFDDQEGVILKSDKGMTLTAKEEIIFAAGEKVVFSSPNQILMATPTGSLVMENEVHLRAPKVHVESTDKTKFSQVEDTDEEESKGIDWGAMWAKAKGAVAAIQWGEVFQGLGELLAGGFTAVLGYSMVTASGVGAGMTWGLAAVPALAVAGVGLYIGADGLSTAAGGLSRIFNGLSGNKDGATLNLMQRGYQAMGWNKAYNNTQIAIGLFSISKTMYTGAISLGTHISKNHYLLCNGGKNFASIWRSWQFSKYEAGKSIFGTMLDFWSVGGAEQGNEKLNRGMEFPLNEGVSF